MKNPMILFILFSFFGLNSTSFAQSSITLKAETAGFDAYTLDSLPYNGDKKLLSNNIEQILKDRLREYPEKILTLGELNNEKPLFFEVEYNGKRVIIAPLLCSQVAQIPMEKHLVFYKIPYGVLKEGIIETEYIYAEPLKFSPKSKRAKDYLLLEDKFKNLQTSRLFVQIKDVEYQKAFNDGRIHEMKLQIENLKD